MQGRTGHKGLAHVSWRYKHNHSVNVAKIVHYILKYPSDALEVMHPPTEGLITARNHLTQFINQCYTTSILAQDKTKMNCPT